MRYEHVQELCRWACVLAVMVLIDPAAALHACHALPCHAYDLKSAEMVSLFTARILLLIIYCVED